MRQVSFHIEGYLIHALKLIWEWAEEDDVQEARRQGKMSGNVTGVAFRLYSGLVLTLAVESFTLTCLDFAPK